MALTWKALTLLIHMCVIKLLTMSANVIELWIRLTNGGANGFDTKSPYHAYAGNQGQKPGYDLNKCISASRAHT